jgi:hypothetical protein
VPEFGDIEQRFGLCREFRVLARCWLGAIVRAVVHGAILERASRYGRKKGTAMRAG